MAPKRGRVKQRTVGHAGAHAILILKPPIDLQNSTSVIRTRRGFDFCILEMRQTNGNISVVNVHAERKVEPVARDASSRSVFMGQDSRPSPERGLLLRMAQNDVLV